MKKLIVVVAIAALLVAAPAAFGASNKLKGTIAGDANSGVTAKSMADNKGTVAKIKGLKMVNVDYVCESGTTGEKSVTFADSSDIYPALAPGLPDYNFSFFQEIPGGSFTIDGSSNKKGTKIKGTVNIIFEEFPDEFGKSRCLDKGGAPGVAFKAKMK